MGYSCTSTTRVRSTRATSGYDDAAIHADRVRVGGLHHRVWPHRPDPAWPGRPKTVASPLLHLVLSYLTKVVRSARWLPNSVRCRALKWRIETFGVRIRTDGRWYGRGRSGIVGSRYQTAVGGALAPVTFDKALPIGQLATLPTVAASLSANGGGTIYISGPGTYHATATIAMAANGAVANVDVYFSTGAKVVIDTGVSFVTSIGPDTYTKLFDWSNCSHVNVYNCYATDNDTTSAAKNKVVCHYFGGNVSHLRFYDCYAKGFTRWMFFVNAYSSGVAGIGTQDGPCDDILFIRPVSVNCGNTTTPDGGFLKIGNNSGTAVGSPYAPVTNIGALQPDITGCNFAFIDMTPSNPSSDNVGAVVNGNYFIEGGQGQMTAGLSGNTFGLWIENAVNWTSAQLRMRNVRIRNFVCDMNGASSGNAAACLLDNTANDVLVEGVTLKNATAGYGISLVGRTGAGLAPMHGRNYVVRNCAIQNCATGIRVSATAGLAMDVIDGVLFDGVALDDTGTGNMTTGVLIATSTGATGKFLRNALFRNVDATHIAVGGTPFSNSVGSDPMEPSIQFERCPGITPLGVGTWVTNSLKNVVSAAGTALAGAIAPTSGTVYFVAAKTGATVSATASGTRTALALTDARGFPLVAFTSCSKAYGGSASTTNGLTYTVTGEDMTVTAAAGTGVTLKVLDFAGNYLNPSGASGDATLTSLFVPNGSTIVVVQSTSPTWTVVGAVSGAIATPFRDSMTGVAIAATWVEYGGTIEETSSVAATWTVNMVKAAGGVPAAVTDPFTGWDVTGDLAGGTATPTTAHFYKAGFDTFLDLEAATTESSIVYDAYGGTIQTTPAGGAAVHVPLRTLRSGHIVKITFTGGWGGVWSDDSGG